MHSRSHQAFPIRFNARLLLLATGPAMILGCAQISSPLAASEASELRAGRAIVTSVQGVAEVRKAESKEEEWQPLFDGKSLKGWKPTDFAGAGKVEVKEGQLFLHSGVMLTGVNWTNEVPKTHYEVSLEAMKVAGSDFFCGLTLPSGDSHFSFICGGWGGVVVGISSIDGMDASENETTKFMNFAKDKWYRIRVRVTPDRIQAWIDDEPFVDQEIGERRIAMRPGEIELSAPFGIAAWQTTAAIRHVKLRKLKSE